MMIFVTIAINIYHSVVPSIHLSVHPLSIIFLLLVLTHRLLFNVLFFTTSLKYFYAQIPLDLTSESPSRLSSVFFGDAPITFLSTNFFSDTTFWAHFVPSLL